MQLCWRTTIFSIFTLLLLGRAKLNLNPPSLFPEQFPITFTLPYTNPWSTVKHPLPTNFIAHLKGTWHASGETRVSRVTKVRLLKHTCNVLNYLGNAAVTFTQEEGGTGKQCVFQGNNLNLFIFFKKRIQHHLIASTRPKATVNHVFGSFIQYLSKT